MPAVDGQRICEAKDCGPVMACGRCNLVWPTLRAARSAGEYVADRPACKDLAAPPITMAEIRDVVVDHAREMEGFQARLVTSGAREKPDMEQLRRAAVCYAAVRILDIAHADKEIMKRLRAGLQGDAA